MRTYYSVGVTVSGATTSTVSPGLIVMVSVGTTATGTTGAGIVINTAKIKAGSSVAIFGMGGIGSSALIASKMNSAGTIIAIDVADYKLEAARSMGATHVVNAREQDVLSEILKITSGGGVDYAQLIVDRLGLTEIFKCIPKLKLGDDTPVMDLTFDDETIKNGKCNIRVKRPDYDEKS